MAPEGERTSDSLIERLRREPHRFEFFAAVRLLERRGRLAEKSERQKLLKPVGADAEPAVEVVRFHVTPSVAFPPSEISGMGEAEAGIPWAMSIAFMGLTGPSGVLPQHYTELQLRSRRDKEPALTDFLDLFNHRLVALLMRAWEKYRLPATYERADGKGTDPITEALFALVGLGTGNLRRRLSVDDQVLLHYAGHFSHWPRSAVALEAILSDYLARPVTIEQFRGRWSVLAVDDQSRLGRSEIDEGQYCRLGLNAVVGDRVWDIQGSFRIRIGPLTYAEFRQFMGEGAMLRKLADLARMFVGAELNFDVQLTLARLEVPERRLGGEGEFYEPRLGWNTWLKDGEYARDVSDAVFQTEDFREARMADWGQGYVSDVEYGRGFYREQSPTLLNLSCLLAGIEPPSLEQGFTYCELGCGQGFTALVLAAANPGSNFIGIDFNPAHIARAEAQARAADLDNIRFIEASFEDLANETGIGLPAFDFVTLHGVYSWVSVANRKAIVAFLARQLKPGGVAYVSYNCMPGWTRALPLQRMLYEFAALVPDRSDRQIGRAVGLIQELADAGASCITDNPFMEMLTRTSAQGELVYLAHEYLNRNWEPLYHADVARELAEAKLEFAGSAWALDHFAELNFSAEQRALVGRVGPPVMRETVKDMLLNRRFRGDVFVRGARRLDNRRRDTLVREVGVALVLPREDVQYKLKVTVGEAELPERTYAPIFDALTEGTRTIGELLDLPELRGVSRTNPVELAGMLAGAQQVLPVIDAASGYRAEATVNRFNRSLARDVEHEPFNKRLALASPVLGTGIHAGVIDLAAFDALSAGRGPDVREVAHRLWKPLASGGEKLLHEGKPVEGEEESLGLLVEKVELVLRAQEPVWRRLGIVCPAIV